MDQESILREISLALQQRKKLSGQVSKLSTEVTTLERTSSTALPSSPSVLAPSASQLRPALQSNFPSPISTQNGFAMQQQFQQQSELQSPQPQLHPVQHQQLGSGRKLSGPLQTVPLAMNPNNRRSQEWPDIPEIGKIEEKNPEILARKILETGRQIEAVKYGAELTPRAGSAASFISGTAPVETTTKRPHSEKTPRSRNKAMPTMTKAPTAANRAAASVQAASTHAESTPRVNDFEDRLKNLITSVLNDNSSKQSPVSSASPVPPPSNESKTSFTVPKEPDHQQQREGLFARAPLKSSLTVHHHAQSQPDYTQFSPAKLALRRHLSQERLYSPQQSNSKNVDMNYIRTVGDLVTGEIERSLERNMERSYIASPSGSFHHSYSPISRPASTDSMALPVTKEVAPVETAVEGLAASLRDSIRTPAEEPTTPLPVDNPTSETEDAPSTSAPKRKRPSVDAVVDQPKEKKSPYSASPSRLASAPPGSSTTKWQDKISSSFDRLVSFASTEMDKRRRSTESCSPRTEPFSSPRASKDPLQNSQLPPPFSPHPSDQDTETTTITAPSSNASQDVNEKKSNKGKESSRDKNSGREKEKKSSSSSSRSSRKSSKERDHHHRKHSSGSSSSKHSHHRDRDRKKTDSSSGDKESKKESGSEKSGDGKSKSESRHKHRDKDKDKAKDSKHREKDEKKEKSRHHHHRSERHRDKSRKSDKGKESFSKNASPSESETLPAAATQLEGPQSEQVPPGEPTACPVEKEEMKSEPVSDQREEAQDQKEEEVEEQIPIKELVDEGHHHFKKRMATQNRMDWEQEDNTLKKAADCSTKEESSERLCQITKPEPSSHCQQQQGPELSEMKSELEPIAAVSNGRRTWSPTEPKPCSYKDQSIAANPISNRETEWNNLKKISDPQLTTTGLLMAARQPPPPPPNPQIHQHHSHHSQQQQQHHQNHHHQHKNNSNSRNFNSSYPPAGISTLPAKFAAIRHPSPPMYQQQPVYPPAAPGPQSVPQQQMLSRFHGQQIPPQSSPYHPQQNSRGSGGGGGVGHAHYVEPNNFQPG